MTFPQRGFAAITNKLEQILRLNIVFLRSKLAGGTPFGFLRSTAKELNSGQPRTNPVSSIVEGLNLDPLTKNHSSKVETKTWTLLIIRLPTIDFKFLLLVHLVVGKLANDPESGANELTPNICENFAPAERKRVISRHSLVVS